MGQEENLPVAITGGGAVGVTLALMLARRGVRVVVFERGAKPQTLPREYMRSIHDRSRSSRSSTSRMQSCRRPRPRQS